MYERKRMERVTTKKNKVCTNNEIRSKALSCRVFALGLTQRYSGYYLVFLITIRRAFTATEIPPLENSRAPEASFRVFFIVINNAISYSAHTRAYASPLRVVSDTARVATRGCTPPSPTTSRRATPRIISTRSFLDVNPPWWLTTGRAIFARVTQKESKTTGAPAWKKHGCAVTTEHVSAGRPRTLRLARHGAQQVREEPALPTSSRLTRLARPLSAPHDSYQPVRRREHPLGCLLGFHSSSHSASSRVHKICTYATYTVALVCPLFPYRLASLSWVCVYVPLSFSASPYISVRSDELLAVSSLCARTDDEQFVISL